MDTATSTTRPLSRSQRRAVREHLAYLRRQLRQSGHSTMLGTRERREQRKSAIGAVRSGTTRRAFAEQNAPAPKPAELPILRAWCRTCRETTSHRGNVCQNHENRSCEDCKRTTFWKQGACTEHTMRWCATCCANAPYNPRTGRCLSATHAKPATPTYLCRNCNDKREFDDSGRCKTCRCFDNAVWRLQWHAD